MNNDLFGLFAVTALVVLFLLNLKNNNLSIRTPHLGGSPPNTTVWMAHLKDEMLKAEALGDFALANPFDNCLAGVPSREELNLIISEMAQLGCRGHLNKSFEELGLLPHLTVVWE